MPRKLSTGENEERLLVCKKIVTWYRGAFHQSRKTHASNCVPYSREMALILFEKRTPKYNALIPEKTLFCCLVQQATTDEMYDSIRRKNSRPVGAKPARYACATFASGGTPRSTLWPTPAHGCATIWARPVPKRMLAPWARCCSTGRRLEARRPARSAAYSAPTRCRVGISDAFS